MRSLDPALHHTGAHTSSNTLALPWSACWRGGTGEGLGRMNLPLPEARLPWPSCHPRGSGALDLCGACTWSQEDFSSKHFFFLSHWSGFCLLPKQRGLLSSTHTT